MCEDKNCFASTPAFIPAKNFGPNWRSYKSDALKSDPEPSEKVHPHGATNEPCCTVCPAPSSKPIRDCANAAQGASMRTIPIMNNRGIISERNFRRLISRKSSKVRLSSRCHPERSSTKRSGVERSRRISGKRRDSSTPPDSTSLRPAPLRMTSNLFTVSLFPCSFQYPRIIYQFGKERFDTISAAAFPERLK
jgi:hypothetical protein